MTCTPPRTTTPAHRNPKSAANSRRCGPAAARCPLEAGEPRPPPPDSVVPLQLPSLLSFLSFVDAAIASTSRQTQLNAAAAAQIPWQQRYPVGRTVQNALTRGGKHRSRPTSVAVHREMARGGGRRIRRGGCRNRREAWERIGPGHASRIYSRASVLPVGQLLSSGPTRRWREDGTDVWARSGQSVSDEWGGV
jgi:hypothetical protein